MPMEMSNRLAKLSYLWTSERSHFVLIKGIIREDGSQAYLIFDKDRREAHGIENNSLARAVCQEMLRHGCPVWENINSPSEPGP